MENESLSILTLLDNPKYDQRDVLAILTGDLEYIGFELDKEYYDECMKRLSESSSNK